MGCGQKTAKAFLLVGNAIFLLAGLGLIALGSFTRYSSKDYDTVVGKDGLAMPANIMIGAGVVVFLVSFLGCYGAIKESRCLLGTFIAFVVLILLAEIGCIVIAFMYKAKAEKVITDGIVTAVQKTYGQNGQDLVTEAVNKIQQTLECCGANSYKDWYNSTWGIQNNHTLPQSCFDVRGSSYKYYSEPCITKMKNWASNNLLIIGGVGIGVFLMECVAIFLAAVISRGSQSIHSV